MNVEVKLFAVAKQLVGAETINLELPRGATVKELRAALVQQHPAMADVVRHVIFAVNTEYADDKTTIPSDAEIACIPPVSGG